MLRRLRGEGMTILLIEEDPHRALSLAEYAYVLVAGEVVAEGDANQIRDDPELAVAYLGSPS